MYTETFFFLKEQNIFIVCFYICLNDQKMFFALCDLAVSFLLFAWGFLRVIRTRDGTEQDRT